MPFTIRPYRRFPVQGAVTHNAGPFQGPGTVWNLSCTGGDSLGICPCVQWKSFRSSSHSRTNKASLWLLLSCVGSGAGVWRGNLGG